MADLRGKHIVPFLGLPAVGKGTQSKRLVKEGGVPAVVGVSSDVIEAYKKKHGIVDPETSDAKSLARLVDDSLVMKAWNMFFQGVPKECELIALDGFPRTRRQCEALSKYLWNKECKVTYVCLEITPAEEKVCDERREQRYQDALAAGREPRKDDRPDVHGERVIIYHENIICIHEYLDTAWEQRVTIHAAGTEDQVFENLSSKLGLRQAVQV